MIASKLELQQVNSAKRISSTPKVVVSILAEDDTIYSVSLSVNGSTVEETMRLAIAKLNKSYNLYLIEDVEQYEMFGARKSGKRKADLPSLMKEQVITKTGMSRFALCPLDQRTKQNSIGELISMKSIETDFNNKQLRSEFECEGASKPRIGCFCF